jgi:membrane protein YdbS with pleckstrin-like domain
VSEQKHISQKSIPLWRTRCTALALPVFFTCGVVLKFTVLWGLLLLLLICAAYALVMLWYFPRRYLSIKFRFGENDVEIQSGVFFQNIYMLLLSMDISI